MSRRLNVQNREVTCIDPPRQTKAVRNRKHGIINAEQKDCEEETQEKTRVRQEEDRKKQTQEGAN